MVVVYYGMNIARRWVALIVLVCSGVAMGDPIPTTLPVGTAYAATAINVAIFRCGALVTAGGFQFVAYYNPAAQIVVGRRELAEKTWDLVTLPVTVNLHDAHNVVVLGVSSDGRVHLSYDQHAQKLRYRVSGKPYDIHSFGDEQAMTGREENHVTYPQFVSGADGTLYFFYRDGASGNGNLCLNKYDAGSGTWKVVRHPLIDGENKCNPYWWRPAVGADGSIHVVWCWRDTPDAATNHDLCYAKSNDGGLTWLRSDGTQQTLPITRGNAEVVAKIAKNSNLINQCSSAVDGSGHPHLVQYMNDDGGIPQYFHIWFDGTKWNRERVSRRTMKFSISGGGSLAIPMSRPEIAISPTGTVYVITRDAEFGGGIRLYHSTAPYEKWAAMDLTHDDLGNWEPSYDIARWRMEGLLDLFVLPVRQGNHERTTDFGPQEAVVLETSLP